jgi:hypothetical protein
MDKRSCPFCGKAIAASASRCPFCREATPPFVAGAGRPSRAVEGSGYVRRGLLWALLAGVFYYFAGGHSPLTLPFAVPSFVNQLLVPLMFLAGVAMALYGLVLRMRG